MMESKSNDFGVNVDFLVSRYPTRHQIKNSNMILANNRTRIEARLKQMSLNNAL